MPYLFDGSVCFLGGTLEWKGRGNSKDLMIGLGVMRYMP